MFNIYDGRKSFFQWDTGQRIVVNDDACCEVHFYDDTIPGVLPIEVYTSGDLRLVNVPDVLLQTCRDIQVWAFVKNESQAYTKEVGIFPVSKRPKPSDYVYTETEVLTYRTLERRIKELEENGLSDDEIKAAVDAALAEAKASGEFAGNDGYTPVKGKDYWTAEDKAEMVNDVLEQVPAPEGTVLYTAQELTEEQKAQARANIGVGVGADSNVEPAYDDIPKVFINGTIPTTKAEVLAEMQYISKTENFTAYLAIKCQGNASMAFDKKNFTVKMYSDDARETKLKKAFKDWGYESHKYVLKANYIDHSHARNIVNARLWNEIVSSRPDYNTLPVEMRNSPRNCAVDGFPIKLYANGTYQGLYTWNISKDSMMFGMDEDNANHCALCAEYNNSANPGAVSEYPSCEFRAEWGGNADNTWEVEVPDTANDAIVESFNNLINCIKDTDDETFMATIGNHLDLQSAFDYYLFAYFGCFFDNLGKNMIMVTYNGTKWFCSMYDMDNTWGLRHSRGVLPQDYNTRCPEGYGESYSLLWQRIEKLYYNELKERYNELRKSVLSVNNVINAFERFTDIISKDLYAEDIVVYPGILFPDVDHVRQIREFVVQRASYVDAQINAMDGSSFCDKDGDGNDDYITEPTVSVTWVAKTISNTSAITDSTTVISTENYIPDNIVAVSVPDNMEISVAGWRHDYDLTRSICLARQENGIMTFPTSVDNAALFWYKTADLTQCYTLKDKLKLRLRYVDQRAITIADGDKVNYTLRDDATVAWRNVSWNGTTYSVNTTRLMTCGSTAGRHIKAIAASGYKLGCLCWKDEDSPKWWNSTSASVGTNEWVQSIDIATIVASGYTPTLVLKRDDGGDIALNESANVTFV